MSRYHPNASDPESFRESGGTVLQPKAFLVRALQIAGKDVTLVREAARQSCAATANQCRCMHSQEALRVGYVGYLPVWQSIRQRIGLLEERAGELGSSSIIMRHHLRPSDGYTSKLLVFICLGTMVQYLSPDKIKVKVG